MFIWLTIALSSFQGRPSSASSIHTSLLQAIDAVMSLALCPQVVSQAPQHFRSYEKQIICNGCFARLRNVQGSTPTWVFECGCRPLTCSSLGFPFHFLLFVASSSNLSGWWCVWSDCHLLRQTSGEHGWLLPPPFSSWRLRPYRLHCLQWPCLTVKPHPEWSLVTEPSLYVMRSCWPFSTVLSHVHWQESLIPIQNMPRSSLHPFVSSIAP